MSNIDHGMNIAQVNQLGQLLKTKSAEVLELIRAVETQIASTAWEGPDARAFKDQWWPEHRSILTEIANRVDGFGQSALNNASEQEGVSQVR